MLLEPFGLLHVSRNRQDERHNGFRAHLFLRLARVSLFSLHIIVTEIKHGITEHAYTHVSLFHTAT